MLSLFLATALLAQAHPTGVNVADFGAKGDGVSDDTAAIQRAADAQVASWADHVILPTLALPSTGLWGDIGYVKFRTRPDGATAELVQDDFYFQTPTAHAVRPRSWDVRLRENRSKTMEFAFER